MGGVCLQHQITYPIYDHPFNWGWSRGEQVRYRKIWKSVGRDYVSLFELFYRERHPEVDISVEIEDFLEIYLDGVCCHCDNDLVSTTCYDCKRSFCDKCVRNRVIIMNWSTKKFKCTFCGSFEDEIKVWPK